MVILLEIVEEGIINSRFDLLFVGRNLDREVVLERIGAIELGQEAKAGGPGIQSPQDLRPGPDHVRLGDRKKEGG